MYVIINFCLVIVDRPSKPASERMNISTLQEGNEMIFSKEYQLPEETTIANGIRFKTKGKEYNLTLVAVNQHTELDVSIMTWTIICGNPVIPGDWKEIKYNWKQRPGTPLSLKLKLKPDVDLPTKPVLRITKVGGQRVTTHDLVSNPNASTIPFSLTYDEDDEVINCLENEELCYEEFTFEDWGLGTNLNSGAGKLIIVTITFDEPDDIGGSYGFAVNIFNQLSNISHNYETGEVIEEEILLLDSAPEGSGEWTKTLVPNWQFNWVETHAKFEGTIQVEFQYTSHENPILYDVDLSEGTWYLPGSSVPAFSILFLKGTARRVQYTLNNTDPEGYQPPPCVMDWPEPEITMQGTVKYTIKHCNGPVRINYLFVQFKDTNPCFL